MNGSAKMTFKASTLDRIDGGISLILRCPGHETLSEISVEDITVDVYISPRELTEGGKLATEHIALIVQSFGEHLAIPHLVRYQTGCFDAGVQPLPAPGMGSIS